MQRDIELVMSEYRGYVLEKYNFNNSVLVLDNGEPICESPNAEKAKEWVDRRIRETERAEKGHRFKL